MRGDAIKRRHTESSVGIASRSGRNPTSVRMVS